MKETSKFLHVGVTVADIDRTIRFYEKYFGFKATLRGTFGSEFIASVPQLYRQQDGVYSDFAFIESPDGIVLELFQFSRMQERETPVWNRPGYHHICLKVPNVPEKYREMAADGVEFYFEPGYRGDPADEEYWVFLKDPDGNMVELQ